MPSFLAGTRNLMMTDCRMIIFVAGICAVIWIRSLVLARDDAVESTVLLFLGVFPTLMFIKNAVLALQIFCMMDRWMCVCKLAYVRTDK